MAISGVDGTDALLQRARAQPARNGACISRNDGPQLRAPCTPRYGTGNGAGI